MTVTVPLADRIDANQLHCNNCGGAIYLPERGILAFDGRFCGHDCKGDYELKRAHWIMRERR
jgi:hypothetical protein